MRQRLLNFYNRNKKLIFILFFIILIIITYDFFLGTVKLSQCNYANKQLKPIANNEHEFWNYTIDKKNKLIIEDVRFTDEVYSKLKLEPKYEKYKQQQLQVKYKITSSYFDVNRGEAITNYNNDSFTKGNIQLLYDLNSKIFVVFQNDEVDATKSSKFSVVCVKKN
jgi:hypothetical protein